MEPAAQPLTQHFLALLDCAKIMRDSAGFHRQIHQHTVSESQWSAFCNQIKIVEHALKGGDKWNQPKIT